MSTSEGPSDRELQEIKARLKAGKMEQKDLKVLQSLVERTEHAAKQLRAALAE